MRGAGCKTSGFRGLQREGRGKSWGVGQLEARLGKVGAILGSTRGAGPEDRAGQATVHCPSPWPCKSQDGSPWSERLQCGFPLPHFMTRSTGSSFCCVTPIIASVLSCPCLLLLLLFLSFCLSLPPSLPFFSSCFCFSVVLSPLFLSVSPSSPPCLSFILLECLSPSVSLSLFYLSLSLNSLCLPLSLCLYLLLPPPVSLAQD